LTFAEIGANLADNGLSLNQSGVVSGTPTTVGTIEFSASVVDAVGGSDERPFAIQINPAYICGDADGNGTVNVSDVTFLLQHVFAEGPAPEPMEAGDVDCSGAINVTDVVQLISFVFGDGPPPCSECP
jgi:hypothetical protein